jgi:hypothetical protein
VAHVNAPQPAGPSGKSVAGLVLGAFLGVTGSIAGALFLFAVGANASEAGRPCQRNLAAGFAEAVAVLGLGVLAWYLFFRVKGDSFRLGFARGLVVAVTLMMLIPWPCSLGFWAAENLTCFMK